MAYNDRNGRPGNRRESETFFSKKGQPPRTGGVRKNVPPAVRDDAFARPGRENVRREDARDRKSAYAPRPAARPPREPAREYRPPVAPPPHPVAPPPRPIIAPPPPAPAELPENLLTGRNPIREAIKAGRAIEKLLIARGELSGSAREIVARAHELGVIVQEVDRSRLDAIYPNHQGMLAYVSAAEYAQLEDLFALAEERGEDPFFVVLDGVTDPHNLGAIIRTAECVGAHGVIVPQRRSVGLTPAAVKAAAGATEYLPVARVTNLSRTIEELKERGLWVLACAPEGEDALKADLTGPVALVIGAEGDGISTLVQKNCDRTISLPMRGRIESLNASVAAGVMLYAVLAARRG